MVAGMEQGLADGSILAEEFFKDLNEETVAMDWDTLKAQESAQKLLDWADAQSVSPAWVWDVKGTPGGDDSPPSGGGEGGGTGNGGPGGASEAGYNGGGRFATTTIIANTKEAAAVAMTMAQMNRRAAIGI